MGKLKKIRNFTISKKTKVNFAEYTWYSKNKHAYAGYCWTPANNVKAVICLVHGLGEHSGRYHLWAERFISEGYAVAAIDLRGHGKSALTTKNAVNIQQLLYDIHLLKVNAAALFPEKTLILYGHSMGGALALNYLVAHKNGFRKVIATSPWLELTFKPSWIKVFMARLVSLVYPAFISSTGLNPEHLSRSHGVAEQYRNDPLVHDKITAGLFFNLQRAGKTIFNKRHKINTPILLMHGAADRITSPDATRRFSKNLALNSVLKIWSDCFHELHNEPEQDEIFAFMSQWLHGVLNNDR